MKLRSFDELNEFLDRELSWRKRELTTTKLLTSKRRSHEQQTLLRSSVCILYAHWEGYVKKAATGYLNFVALQGLDYRHLVPSLVALGLRAELRAAQKSDRMSIHTKVAAFMLSDMRHPAKLPWQDAVNTGGNVNSDVLQEVLGLLALNYTPYETKRVLIDEKLLARRNKIAHGEQLRLDIEDYEEVHSEVLILLNMFRDDIENAALMKAFMRI